MKQLQRNVIVHFGKNINTATDCDHLAHLLNENLNENVSSQTLRRFFGLIKSTSRTSLFTLDILSRFCGFKNYENFRLLSGNKEFEQFFGSDEDSGNDFWQKSEELCMQIADSSEMLVNTHYRMMPFPMARKYFMENHPMRDMLGTVYSQYFLSYLKFNQNNEAKIFAYGFLFQSAFLQQNRELMELYFHKVETTECTPEVHVIPAGLKFGVMLLYADFIGNDVLFDETFELMKIHRVTYISASEQSVCSFEYTVLESLIFTDRTAEMLYLIENNIFHNSEMRVNFIPQKRKGTHDEVWKILCAVAYDKASDKEKSLRCLQVVNLENLGFGWSKYYSIIFYFVLIKYSEPKEQNRIYLKLYHLISETHFSFYDDKMTSLANQVLKKRSARSKKLTDSL